MRLLLLLWWLSRVSLMPELRWVIWLFFAYGATIAPRASKTFCQKESTCSLYVLTERVVVVQAKYFFYWQLLTIECVYIRLMNS